MRQIMPTPQLIASALDALAVGRYSIASAYVVCFYDWIISLDQEVAFIYPAPWNAVKGAYLFCRYWPLVVAPFHLWGFIGNHERGVCETHYHVLYACTVPTMLSSQFILMLRTYAFTGRRRTILAALSITFFSLVGVAIWVMSTQLTLSALFLIEERSACFATSDQPDFNVVRTVGAYHLGMVSLLSAIFDCLNMFLVIWHCFQQRGTFGPLGQSFLKQGRSRSAQCVAVCHCLFGSGHRDTRLRYHDSLERVDDWDLFQLESVASRRWFLVCVYSTLRFDMSVVRVTHSAEFLLVQTYCLLFFSEC
ncbi:hypothetical protein H4582DRAFT_1164237 [Lactarius indigo]|nr:hypothetical protein H4582DRAFT_1164237 [Lactarius indigo]